MIKGVFRVVVVGRNADKVVVIVGVIGCYGDKVVVIVGVIGCYADKRVLRVALVSNIVDQINVFHVVMIAKLVDKRVAPVVVIGTGEGSQDCSVLPHVADRGIPLDLGEAA